MRREDVINLLAFIDWLLTLPQDLEQEYWQEVEQLEAQHRMQYITSFERRGIQKGLQKGISLGLKLKFGEAGQNLLPEIEAIQDVSLLETILKALESVSTLEELRQVYQNHN
ncbi:hypothetical protein F7734_11575 [Scytonema sp. UIC 10036]|uniref:hypothetical protein n=1 Tax=Scytonema sp. UIC 10036 TaxID=2304196 RepID=UPI0012DAA88F|nr:hypothetical protein [Scytonema sp. UIC 10036]MUG93043.1 hypothetical protein [Scytonema sp. UIC 10036]